MRTRFAKTATDLLDQDPHAALVLADISLDLLRAARRQHPSRVINVGIMEQSMIGVAAGFALEGFRPIVHTIGPFLVERPFEQVKLDAGYQDVGMTLVSAGASYDYAAEGGTHHAPGDVQLLSSIPGVEVFVPGHPDELEALLRITYANGRVSYIRTSVSENEGPHDVRPGRIEVLRRGEAATVIAFGPMLSRTLEGVGDLDVDILYATSVMPFDHATLAGTVGNPALVILVEPFYEGTVTGEVATALRSVPARIVPIGVPRRFIRRYGKPPQHDGELGLDSRSIRRRVVETLDGPTAGSRSTAGS